MAYLMAACSMAIRNIHAMKEIKDYLHFYLGQKISRHIDPELSEVGVLKGICQSEVEPDKMVVIIDYSGECFTEAYIEEVKPILRPLSDMTEEEGYEIYFQYFGSETAEDWSGDTGSAYFQPKKIRPGKYHGLRIVNGTDYSSGDFGTVIKILPFLLSRGFDLKGFDLIDAGLAIDATKIKI